MKKGITIVALLAVLITLYEVADFLTHGNIIGYFFQKKASVFQSASDFTPKYLGLWTQGGLEIQKCRVGSVLDFTGLDPAAIVKQGSRLIYAKSDGSNVDALMLTRLEWSESKEVYMEGDTIPFHIAPGYKMKPNMYEIIFDPVLRQGYYALHFGQNTAGYAYGFIVIDDAEESRYTDAIGVCENFWKYLLAEKYSKLSDLLSSDLAGRGSAQGAEPAKFRSEILDKVLIAIKGKCEQTDPFWVNFPQYEAKKDTLEYSPALRLDKIRPINAVRGKIVIPYEVNVISDKQTRSGAEADIEVMDGKISGYEIF
ncbi:MAG: hypothetical protein AB1847_05450 [bacterium]